MNCASVPCSPHREVSALLLLLACCAVCSFAQQWPPVPDLLSNDCLRNPLTCDPPPMNISQFSTVLVVVAHPDDESCATGTLAHLIARGVTAHFVYLTNGDSGTQNTNITRAENAAQRQNEVRKAVQAIGGSGVHFLEYPDGDLQNTYDTRGKVVFYIRYYQPELVLTWNPQRHVTWYKQGVEHADHRAAGAIALASAYPLSHDPLYFYEQILGGVSLWRPTEVWLFSWAFHLEDPSSNVFMSLSQGDVNKKALSLFQHKSQVKGTLADVTRSVEQQARKLGKVVGVEYAEWFVRVLV